MPNQEDRVLQVNDTGAWKNVMGFHVDDTSAVLEHVAALGALTTRTTFRISRDQHAVVHYWTKDKGWQAK